MVLGLVTLAPFKKGKQKKSLPASSATGFPTESPKVLLFTNTSQIQFLFRGHSFLKRKNSLLRFSKNNNNKKKDNKHFTNAYGLIEVSELFRHAINYSANIYISIFIKLQFHIPTSSFMSNKAIRGVMSPAKLSLGTENELNIYLFVIVILGRQPG